MNKFLSMLTIGTLISVSSAAYAACPDPANRSAHYTVLQRAYDLSNGAKSFAADIGGSTSWNDCGIPGEGFFPSQPSVRLDLSAAEGKQLTIEVVRGCARTYMYVQAGEYTDWVSGSPATENVSLTIPRANIGNDQTVLIYLSSSIAGEVCQGAISFETARG